MPDKPKPRTDPDSTKLDVDSQRLEIQVSALEHFARVTPFLWFDSNAEAAVNFYLGIFKNSRRREVLRNVDERQGPVGSVQTIAFELDGAQFTALNGGPTFKFTEAISFTVRCDSQEEVDYYWAKLVEGGTAIQCGWLKDKFGLCWQIVPAQLPDLIRNPNAFAAMLTMVKLDIAQLQRAAME